MAKERKDHVDKLVATDSYEEDAIFAYVKLYGLESFIDITKKEEFKETLIKNAPADRPVIVVKPENYDFEDVNQSQGVVSTLFEVKNEGKTDLVINKLESSCGCTSASIVYKGNEGPKFSMPGHGTNEEIGDWKVAITPGETAQLKVYYDPNVHKDFRGGATRTISIFSNDPVNLDAKVQIDLNQVD